MYLLRPEIENRNKKTDAITKKEIKYRSICNSECDIILSELQKTAGAAVPEAYHQAVKERKVIFIMAGRPIYDPEGFKNVEKDGEICGFQFAFKLQYYRGITLSIIRDIAVTVDGKEYPREDVLLTVNGETFDLEQTKTVVSPLYRWEFGDYATVTVKAPGGLSKGKHHISTLQHIAPSYMPFPIKAVCEADFEI